MIFNLRNRSLLSAQQEFKALLVATLGD